MQVVEETVQKTVAILQVHTTRRGDSDTDLKGRKSEVMATGETDPQGKETEVVPTSMTEI